MTPLEWLLGGGLLSAAAAFVKVYTDLRAVQREDKTAETGRYDDLWVKLNAISDKADREAEECRQRLAESEKERREAMERADIQRTRDRAAWQEDFDKMSDKYRHVLRICADQEEEIQHSRIVIAKITERRGLEIERPAPAPMLGGKRTYDVPVPGETRVTVTVPTPPPAPPPEPTSSTP